MDYSNILSLFLEYQLPLLIKLKNNEGGREVRSEDSYNFPKAFSANELAFIKVTII